MSQIENLFKEFNKKYKEELFTVGTSIHNCSRIPFSSMGANRILYGGIPRGRITEFAGEEGSGKTTTALDVGGNAQKLFTAEWLESINTLQSLDKLTKELTAKTVQEKTAEFLIIQKEQEETEKMLLEGFANGYIKCGNLYALISYSKVRKDDVSRIVQSCKVGGFTDWRRTTVTELDVVKQACRYYYSNKECYTKISADKMEQLKKIFEGDAFWVDGLTVVTKDGSSKYYGDSNYTYGLILVRDAK